MSIAVGVFIANDVKTYLGGACKRIVDAAAYGVVEAHLEIVGVGGEVAMVGYFGRPVAGEKVGEGEIIFDL